MGYLPAPPNVVLSPNLIAFVIDTSNRYTYAAITRGKGIWVWRHDNPTRNLLDDLHPDYADERAALWGAPDLCWRPHDQQLILSSVTADERSVVVIPVPGIFFNH